MSTEGSARRTWIDAEIYTETKYYDGDPDQTFRSHVVRIGPFEARFDRWPGNGFTHRRDWRVFRGSDYLMGRTPWGNWDVQTDSMDFVHYSESGDVPRTEALMDPIQRARFDMETAAMAPCATCRHLPGSHALGSDTSPHHCMTNGCKCTTLVPSPEARSELLRQSRG